MFRSKMKPVTTVSTEPKFPALVWTIGLEMVLMLLMGSVDTWMLSAVSDGAVAAAGLSNQYVTLGLLVLRIVTVGTQVVLAQYLGAGHEQEGSRAALASLYLNAGIGGAISLLLVVFSGPLLELLQTSDELMPAARSYLIWVGGSLVLQSLVNGLTAIIRIYGHTQLAMYASVGMNLANIAGNAVFIFGLAMIPAMGVTGAAVSTCLSRGLTMLVLFMLFAKLTGIRFRMPSRDVFHPEDLGRMVKVGVPSAMETFLYHAVQTVFIALISHLGTEALAGRQYAVNLTMFITCFGSAFSSANMIMVGRYVGGGRFDEAYQQTWLSIRLSLIAVLIANCAVILYREPLVGLFTGDAEVIRIAGQLLLLNLFVETGKCLNMNTVSALRAVGDARFPLLMAIISMAGISLSIGYGLTAAGLGAAGIWIATGLDEWIRGLSMMGRWRSRKWEAAVLVPQHKTAAPAKGGVTAAKT
ncbi:MATE family efflux transporter [Paenibacillus tarimensis]|uniref:MATE family efflux transporter n=1 Tax=Paenibacillus tarimensis TaxID=416012 RepID=UPI001F336542|nr:MATE family efflux transporter [Paenibacillus tarimensis]MCF2944699.1 MATE family efflux transporter [Paenibacillus tarimensis]